MMYRIGFMNGHVIEVEDCDVNFRDIGQNTKYVVYGNGELIVNMKHVTYIQKVGEEIDRETKELS